MKVFASIGFVFLVVAALSGVTVLVQFIKTGIVVPNISYAILNDHAMLNWSADPCVRSDSRYAEIPEDTRKKRYYTA